MNAERLHVVIKELNQKINSSGLISSSNKVVETLKKYTNNQQNQNVEKEFGNTLDEFYKSVEKTSLDDFSPAWLQIIEEIGGSDYLGHELIEMVEQIFSRNQITPSVALEEFQNIQNELKKFTNSINNIEKGFKDIGIGEEDLEENECEIGILVPRSYVKNQLNQFGGEIKELDFILKIFQEISTGNSNDIKIKTISSSNLMMFLDIAPEVAAFLSVSIERVISLYKHLLEIRKLKGELKDQGVPDESLKGINTHSNKIMREEIEKIVNEKFEEYYEGNDNERKNELTNAYRICLNKIANRIDNGFNFEIRIQQVKTKEDGEESEGDKDSNKFAKTINSASQTLRFLKLQGDSILSLPESTEEESED